MTTKITNGTITVTSNYLTLKQKRELMELAVHAGKLVGLNWDLVDSLRLSVRMESVRGKMWAAVTQMYDPGDFLVVLRASSYFDLSSRCSLLLHELTHVKQYTIGDLVVLDDKSEWWKGSHKIDESLVERILENESDEEYENLPWEKECYDNERKYLLDMLQFDAEKYFWKDLTDDMNQAFVRSLGSPSMEILRKGK